MPGSSSVLDTWQLVPLRVAGKWSLNHIIMESFKLEKTFRIIESNHEEQVWPDSSSSFLPLFSRTRFGFMDCKEVQEEDKWMGGGHVRFVGFSIYFILNINICINITLC